jgi:large subunit ribosomal protein L18Ae
MPNAHKQIIRVDTVASNKLRRPNLKQFVNSKIRFPLAHRTVRPINRRMAKTFSATRPSTFFA